MHVTQFLEPFVNTIEHTFRYPDGLVATPLFPGWRSGYRDTLLILEQAPDGSDILGSTVRPLRKAQQLALSRPGRVLPPKGQMHDAQSIVI